jgi:glucoamylase
VSESLEEWIAREQAHAATAMLRSVSATGLVKRRAGFAQTVRPAAGSIVASPVLAAYDPDPDYFFHWFRDSAVVMDAVRVLYETGRLGAEALVHFADFVRFTLSLRALDGRALAERTDWRRSVQPEFEKYLRAADDLASVEGDAVYAEARVNPDATLDVSRWSRPQHDGTPLRALVLLRWLRLLRTGRGSPGLAAEALADAERLLRNDLALTAGHWRTPSFDIWEEELGVHYYTLRVSAAALARGAAWLEQTGDARGASALRGEATSIRALLDRFFMPDAGCYASRLLPTGATSPKTLDIAVILGVVHCDDDDEAHSAGDPRMQATLSRLEQLFDRLYAINRRRPAERGVAMGRYEGDVYYAGGAYYFSTLGAAEFCFRAAKTKARAGAAFAEWAARGDGFLEAVRAFTPASGDLAEQFDQRTGEPQSAKHLAWSYAAFISCVAARAAVTAS